MGAVAPRKTQADAVAYSTKMIPAAIRAAIARMTGATKTTER